MQLSDYDRRQLGRILATLDRYQNDGLPIDALISGVDALIAVLETKDSAFRSSLQKEWGTLEIAYASALDKGRIPFGGDDRKSIEPALVRLRELVSADAVSEDD
jgi:hypothetical protein